MAVRSMKKERSWRFVAAGLLLACLPQPLGAAVVGSHGRQQLADLVGRLVAARPVEPPKGASLAGAIPAAVEERAEEVEREVKRKEKDITYLRPNLGGGPEVIKFGMFCRSVSKISLAHGTFFADMVVTLLWSDLRAAILPKEAGASSVTVSEEVAQRRIWMPDVTVTNRAPSNAVSILSSGIQIDTDGNVKKIVRVMLVAKTAFSVRAFPFDRQDLIVQMSSESLMSDELIFEALNDNVSTGVRPGLLEMADFQFLSSNTMVREQIDATLHKSRAEFHILAKRRSMPYVQSLLIPELLVLAIAFSVFWFPLRASFVMPRVSTALLAFLALTTLGLKSNAQLPVRSGLNWMDVFETICQTSIFVTLAMNIIVLVVFHSFKEQTLARHLNHELKLFFPILAGVCFGVCFSETDGTGLTWMSLVVNAVLAVALILYAGMCAWRLKRHIKLHHFWMNAPSPSREASSPLKEASSPLQEEAESWTDEEGQSASARLS